MADYRFLAGPGGRQSLLRAADGACIPFDPANSDYRAYLAWTALGGVADPVPAAAAQVVLSVRPVALRWALRQTPDPTGVHANLFELIEVILAQPGYVDAQDAFDHAVVYERADILALIGAMGFTEAQVDAVLVQAAGRPGAEPVYGPKP